MFDVRANPNRSQITVGCVRLPPLRLYQLFIVYIADCIMEEHPDHCYNLVEENTTNERTRYAHLNSIDNEKESETKKQIWPPNTKPSRTDIAATKLLLKIRGQDKYQKGFLDKTTTKLKLWNEIADELRVEGYDVGRGKEGAERCRQKFSNLQNRYLAHIKHMNTKGEKKKDPPPFFDLLHEILGAKHKVTPEFLCESIQNYTASIMESFEISEDNIKDEIQEENEYCPETPDTYNSEQSILSVFVPEGSFSNNETHKRQQCTQITENKTDKVTNILENIETSNEEFNIIGQNVAMKLRRMPRDTRIYTEKLINDLLFKAELGQINQYTTISTYLPN